MTRVLRPKMVGDGVEITICVLFGLLPIGEGIEIIWK